MYFGNQRKAKAIGAGIAAVAMLLPLAACGSNGAGSADPSSITIYTMNATYEGALDGYVGKGIKDATGLSVNVVPDQVGGTSRFQTRLTTGDLGDIVIFSSREMLKDAIDAGVVEDLTQYKDQLKNAFRFTDGINRMKGLDDGKVYGIPTGVTNQKGQISKVDPTNAPSMRYDYYKELGSPEVKDYWDYAEVAEKMAQAHPKTEKGDNFYALSLFGGWDQTSATQLRSISQAYGWTNGDGINSYNFVNIDPIAKKTEDLLADGSTYMQALKWANGVYQAGQLDPDSATQTWDDYLKKAEKGQSAMWVYGYMGNLNYNPANKDMTAQNKGYERIPADSLNFVEGSSTLGGNWFWGLSSNAKNKEGALKFMNYMFSDEGSFTYEVGPKGVLWDLNKEGEPEFTELGKKPWSTTDVPAKLGGGKISDTFKFRVNASTAGGVNPLYHATANYNEWNSTLKDNATSLDKEWTADHDGALNMKEYLVNNDKVKSFEVQNLDPLEWSDEEDVVIKSVGDVIKQYSWKMIYAKSDAEFTSLADEMVSKAKSLGYDKIVAKEDKAAQTFFNAL